jgi:deoxycytidylate deaminase
MPDPKSLVGPFNEALWTRAVREATRSPLEAHGMGAVLFDPHTGRLLSNGCAHSHAGGLRMATVHAEQHALARAKHVDLRGAWCAVCALNAARDGCSHCARPCGACARELHRAGVTAVVFCELAAGTWKWRLESVAELAEQARRCGNKVFSRHLRLSACA